MWPAVLAGLAVLLLLVLGFPGPAALWLLAAVGAAVVVFIVRKHPAAQTLLGAFLTVGCVLATFLGGLFFVPAALALLAIGLTGGVSESGRESHPPLLPETRRPRS